MVEQDQLLQDKNVNTYREGKSFHKKSFCLMILTWISLIVCAVYLILRFATDVIQTNAELQYLWIAFPAMYFIYYGLKMPIRLFVDSFLITNPRTGTMLNVSFHN